MKSFKKMKLGQRFGHPGGIANYGQGNCKGLDKLEFDSEELKEEDAKVNNERKRKRGVKRDAPESGINDETPSAKKRKKNQAQDPYFKMMMDLQKQQMEMQMEMQMKIMKVAKEMEIQAQVDLKV